MREVSVRAVAVGDPQTSTERFFGALDSAQLIGEDGWLRRDVRLVAMGDYFDYYVADRAHAQREGVLVLAWLAAHEREQVTILFGNHDAARVMELATVDDDRFEAAHRRATSIAALPRHERGPMTRDFLRDFPELATPGYAARDYNAFTVEQRDLVVRLLLARRFDLAVAERALDGTPVLMTHAGVTMAQLAQLGIPDEREPAIIASALNERLEQAIDAVEDDWRAGKRTALSLEPLHVAGRDGKEGGGMLYQRPADPDRDGADSSWEREAHAPRRFDPRELPSGVVQVVGHTGHLKAYEEMPRWREPDMPAPTKTAHRGGLRTIAVTTHEDKRLDVSYRSGIQRGEPGDAVMWMIDPEMHYVPTARDVAILELDPKSSR